MVNVLRRLCIVHNLLLLQSQALMKQLLVELAVFSLLDDLPLEFYLLFEACDLLSQKTLSLVGLKLVLLTEDLLEFPLVGFVVLVDFHTQVIDFFNKLVTLVDQSLLILSDNLAFLKLPV